MCPPTPPVTRSTSGAIQIENKPKRVITATSFKLVLAKSIKITINPTTVVRKKARPWTMAGISSTKKSSGVKLENCSKNILTNTMPTKDKIHDSKVIGIDCAYKRILFI